LPPIKGFFELKKKQFFIEVKVSTQHTIDITPELKSQVEQGQALFQAEGDGKRVIKIAGHQ
jgi:hypothetical protein